MKHYRVHKVTKPGGTILKTKHIIAVDDVKAMKKASDDADCPVCEVQRDDVTVGTLI
ncbi:MAG TPA: hypothetical protein VGD10_10160 [Allosphingosinicella sp.]|uniref:hypothetical protein n=1 Tax=Allosphingosinicella sp. TaxID=2823234 RepID=UPI002ED88DE7